MILRFDGKKTIISGEGTFKVGNREYTMEEMKRKLKKRIKNNSELKKNFKNKEVLEELRVEG